jgi:hypothetical protein
LVIVGKIALHEGPFEGENRLRGESFERENYLKKLSLYQVFIYLL